MTSRTAARPPDVVPTLETFLLTAEAVLGIDAGRLLNVVKIGLAESALAAPTASFGGVDFYPEPIDQAAVLCSRIVRNHPLPDGNKRVALLMMLEQLAVHGFELTGASQDEIAEAVETLAEGTLSEDAFAEWLREHVRRVS